MLIPLIQPQDEDWPQREALLQQAKEAFSTEPSFNGVIQGRRWIELGKRGFRTSYFPSKKNASGHLTSVYLPMESRLELAYAVQLERASTVRAFRTQAIELDVPGGTHFPDFLVVDHTGYLHLFEVKPDRRYLSTETLERTNHLHQKLARWGISYAIVDSLDLPQGRQLENLLWLNQRITTYPERDEIEAFRALHIEKSTFGELRALCGFFRIAESLVSFLLFTGELHTDWTKPIDDESEVWR